MGARQFRYFVGDFETTVYPNQEKTEVWAAACVEMGTEAVNIFHSIGELFDYLCDLNTNIVIYFHNLKFDGSFWLPFLLHERRFRHAADVSGPLADDFTWKKPSEMRDHTLSYTISDLGQWYIIRVKSGGHYIEIRDSLKLLPFSVKQIGKSFQTKHQKLEMEYTGYRFAGCRITDEEKRYISNDVLVIKEALEIMFDEGHNKLTIGACCLDEFKKLTGPKRYKLLFPDLSAIPIAPQTYGAANADEYIRRAYRGGWCYVVPSKAKKVFRDGITADVNSLYPSMMSSESGNRYPVGLPVFWRGNYIPEEARAFNKFFFVRIKTRFYIKKDRLPFIQIKSTLLYRFNESLESSDVFSPLDGRYHRTMLGFDGNVSDCRPILTLTMMDFELLQDQYNLEDFEILDGCYFKAQVGIFDSYIEKYKKIKLESTGAKKTLAKLYLNNLYGKMAASTSSSFRVAMGKQDGTIGFYTVEANDKKPGYIACGAAITSYARCFTIRAAQANYYGPNKPGFIYADTDSIHADLPPDRLRGIRVHDKNFCAWKLESSWDVGFFVRQKTYIEHIIAEEQRPIANSYYSIKCAGMPERCKQLFRMSMEGYTQDQYVKLNDIEREFVKVKRELTDFNVGLVVPGKLLPKRIPGGVVLTDTLYEMR